MSKGPSLLKLFKALYAIGLVVSLLAVSSVRAQSFDFTHLEKVAREFTVIVKMQVEFSFGMQSNEHEQRLLGTIVTSDGLVIFDGSFLSDHNPFLPVSSFSFRTMPNFG